MKKRLLTIISLIIAICASVFALTGCDLVTTDTERDMEQVVATVNIGGYYKGQTEEVKKKDMIIAYMNYGYYYTQTGEYTPSQVFESILDNLINERVLVQTAKVAIMKDENLSITDWSAESFVGKDTEDYFEAQYNAVSSIKSLVESRKETVEKKQDTIDSGDRTVPTDAKAYTEKLTYNKDLVDKVIGEVKDFSDQEQMIAYNKVVKLLEVNSLVGDIKDNDLFTTYYYQYLLDSCYEAKIVEKYEKILLKDKNINNISYEVLVSVFNDLYDSQVKLYEKDDAGYKDALGKATKTAPILYAKEDDSFGYVWNLLIGATEEQTDKIGKIDKTNKTDEAIQEERENILINDIIMKDQRSSWVYNGYDAIFNVDEDGVGTLAFVNDYSFVNNNNYENIDDMFTFQGTIKWLNMGEYKQRVEKNEKDGKFVIKYYDGKGNVDETYEPELSVVKVDEVKGKDAIIDKIEKFVDGYSGNKDDMIKELIFAFSTDPGSLTSYNGYVIKIGDKNTTYVPEFQRDGEKVLDKEEGSLIVSTTDYGYHFMFNNGMAKKYETLDAYCKAVDGIDNVKTFCNDMIANWVSVDDDVKKTYIYSFANTYLENILSTYETEIQRTITSDKDKVVKFESRYADLLGE